MLSNRYHRSAANFLALFWFSLSVFVSRVATLFAFHLMNWPLPRSAILISPIPDILVSPDAHIHNIIVLFCPRAFPCLYTWKLSHHYTSTLLIMYIACTNSTSAMGLTSSDLSAACLPQSIVREAGFHSAQEKSPIIVEEVDACACISHLLCLQFRLINATKPRETNSEHSKCFMLIAKSGKNQQRHHAKQLHCSRKNRVWIDGHDSKIPKSLQLDQKFRQIVLGCKRTMKAKLPKKTKLVKAARLIPAAKRW